MDSMSSSEIAAFAYADVRNGWARTASAIRSVVSHPLALPLVLCLRFFDDVDMTDQLTMSGGHFMSYLRSLCSQPEKKYNNTDEDSSTLDKLMRMAWLVDDLNFTTTVQRVFNTFSLKNLFANLNSEINGWMRRAGSNEKALVALILKTFRECQPLAKKQNVSASTLLFQSGDAVKFENKTGENPNCFFDLLVAQHVCENVGSIKELNAEIELRGDKPVLMSIVTIEKETGAFQIALFLCWRRQVASTATTGQEKMGAVHKSMAQLSVSNESNKDKDTKVFAKEFDMILLWHTIWNPDDQVKQQKATETEDPTQCEGENNDNPGSNELAKAFVAIFFAMQCMENWQTIECSDNFLVLGPSCCKVKLLQSGSTPVVLRSYDTRFCPTSCSPHVYLNAKVKESYGNGLEEDPMQLDLPTLGRPLLYLAKSPSATENTDVCNFGNTSDIQQIAEVLRRDWLWDNSGKLQLIETAFQESRQPKVHMAQRPGDFIPIINHLQHLHEQGFVHGDIRAFNMVFDGEDGKLIDFDISGVAGETRYPPGYKKELPDAIHRCGVCLHLIEKQHDWYALGNVIFSSHGFQEPDGLVEQDTMHLFSKIYEISKGFRNLQVEKGLPEARISSLVTKLKELLKQLDANAWTCWASHGLYYYYENNMQGQS